MPDCHIPTVSHVDRYRRLGDFQDLDDALKYGQEAVEATPEGHTNLTQWQHSLAESYRHWYQHTGDLQELEAALMYGQAAVAATPEGHLYLPQCYKTLATLYLQQYMTSGDAHLLKNASECYTFALHSPNAAPQNLWDIAVSFTQHTQFFEPKHILEGFSLALNTLSSLLWLGHSIKTRHEMLLMNSIPKTIPQLFLLPCSILKYSMQLSFLNKDYL
jgi:hypothetical protein